MAGIKGQQLVAKAHWLRAAVIVSVIGAGVSLMRGGHRSWEDVPHEEEGAAAELLIEDVESGAML